MCVYINQSCTQQEKWPILKYDTKIHDFSDFLQTKHGFVFYSLIYCKLIFCKQNPDHYCREMFLAV